MKIQQEPLYLSLLQCTAVSGTNVNKLRPSFVYIFPIKYNLFLNKAWSQFFLYFLHRRDTSRAAIVHLNFRAGSTFLVPVCTVPSSVNRTNRCNKVDAVRLYASYRLNLLLLKWQICVRYGYGESACPPLVLSEPRLFCELVCQSKLLYLKDIGSQYGLTSLRIF